MVSSTLCAPWHLAVDPDDSLWVTAVSFRGTVPVECECVSSETAEKSYALRYQCVVYSIWSVVDRKHLTDSQMFVSKFLSSR